MFSILIHIMTQTHSIKYYNFQVYELTRDTGSLGTLTITGVDNDETPPPNQSPAVVATKASVETAINAIQAKVDALAAVKPISC